MEKLKWKYDVCPLTCQDINATGMPSSEPAAGHAVLKAPLDQAFPLSAAEISTCPSCGRADAELSIIIDAL